MISGPPLQNLAPWIYATQYPCHAIRVIEAELWAMYLSSQAVFFYDAILNMNLVPLRMHRVSLSFHLYPALHLKQLI